MWQQLDEQIVRLFHACNLPFNIADHPMWKETVGMLRPGYTHQTEKKSVVTPRPSSREPYIKDEDIAERQ